MLDTVLATHVKNILWHPLHANQDGGPVWRTGSIFSCCKGLWDCLVLKPITTMQQSVLRHTPAIFVGTCRWISPAADSGRDLAAATAGADVESWIVIFWLRTFLLEFCCRWRRLHIDVSLTRRCMWWLCVKVREQAVTTLVELYRHVGERLRMDVSKKDINTAKYDIASVTTQHNNHNNNVICIALFTDLSRTLTRTRDVCCAKYFSFEAVRPAIQKLHCPNLVLHLVLA